MFNQKSANDQRHVVSDYLFEEDQSNAYFTLSNPHGKPLSPGQYIEIVSPNHPDLVMYLSVAHSDENILQVAFPTVSIRQGGSKEAVLRAAQNHQPLLISEPKGQGLLLPIENNVIHVLAAGSAITTARHLMLRYDAYLHYSSKELGSLMFLADLISWKQHQRAHISLTQTDVNTAKTVGFSHGRLNAHLQGLYLSNYAYYVVAGPNPFILAMLDELESKGVSDEQIFVCVNSDKAGPMLPKTEAMPHVTEVPAWQKALVAIPKPFPTSPPTLFVQQGRANTDAAASEAYQMGVNLTFP